MLYDTHLAGGVLSGAAVLFVMGAPPETWPGALFLAGAAAVLPDIDHGRAALNQALRKAVPVAGGMASAAMRAVLGHRAATHSVAALAGLAALLKFAVPVSAPLFAAALAGYLSHLILDTFNPHGVWWTWPFGKRWSLRKVLPWPFTFETGSRIEVWALRPALWLGAVFLVAKCLGLLSR